MDCDCGIMVGEVALFLHPDIVTNHKEHHKTSKQSLILGTKTPV